MGISDLMAPEAPFSSHKKLWPHLGAHQTLKQLQAQGLIMEKQNNLFGVENEGEWMPPPRFVIEFYIKLTPCGAVVSTRGGYNGQPPTLAHTKKY